VKTLLILMMFYTIFTLTTVAGVESRQLRGIVMKYVKVYSMQSIYN